MGGSTTISERRMSERGRWRRRAALNSGRGPRHRMIVAAMATAVCLASCSALSTPIDDGDAAGPGSSEPTGGSGDDDTGAGGDATVGDGTDAEPGGDADGPAASVWERADDALFLPDSPRSGFEDLLGPTEPGGDWTVIGSIFDYVEVAATPTVWTTDDPLGKDWTAVTIEHPAGSADSRPTHAERFDSTIVAVGRRGRNAEVRPAVWLGDGADWSAVDTGQFDLDRESWLNRLAAGNPEQGLFALGGHYDEARRVLTDLWHSEDGRSWSLLDVPFVGETDDANSIAVADSGVVVAGSQTVGSVFSAAAWFSPDGRTWEQVEVPDLGSEWTIVNSVTAIDGRFVAVGGAYDDGIQRPVAWTSDDGITWSEDGGTFELDDPNVRSSNGFGSAEVDVAGGRVVATATASSVQHVWTSTDGRTWRPLRGLLDFRSRGFSVAGFGGTSDELTVATGLPSIVHHGDGWADAAPTSLAMPAPRNSPFMTDLIATDSGFTAVGGNNTLAPDGSPLNAAAAWTSDDGLTWTRVSELRRAERGSITAGVFDGADVVAVGRERLGSDPASPSDGLLWRSVSEERWQPESDLSFSAEQSRIGFDAATLAGDTLIVGGFSFQPDDELGVEPIVVESADGETFDRSTTPLAGPGNQIVDELCGADDGSAVAVLQLSEGNDTDIGVAVRDGAGRWTAATDADGSFSAASSQGVDDCIHGIDGFMAVGWVFNGTDSDIGLWTSADGTSWSTFDGLGVENDEAEQWLAAAAAYDDGYVLVGRDGLDFSLRTNVWFGRGDDWVSAPLPAEADGLRRITMTVSDGVVVVSGAKDGARRVYRTTIEAVQAGAAG